MALAHRPSALKQQNKKHNSLGHKTKGQVAALTKGRVGVKSLTKSLKKELSREQRRHQSKQIRSNKREEVIYKKRQLGTNTSPPFLVCVIPLNENINLQKVLEHLTDCDDSSVSKSSDQGIRHLSCSRLKQRFSFVVPPSNDLYAVLDTVKVSDTILFVWRVGEEVNRSTDLLLSSLRSQLMPTVVHAVVGEEELTNKPRVPRSDDLERALKSSLVISEPVPRKEHKKMRVLKDLQVDISSRFPGAHARPYYLNKVQDVNLILRQIGSQKQKGIFYRDQRAHIMAEKIAFEGEGSTGTLKVYGYVRRQPLSVNSLVHIPGFGEFQMHQMDSAADPFPLLLGGKRNKKGEESPYDEDAKLLDRPDPELQQGLDATCEVDECDSMEGEQTWPTKEEMAEALAEAELLKKKKRKLPRGTSDYQATWDLYYDDDEEAGGGDDDEDDDESEGELMEDCGLDYDSDVGSMSDPPTAVHSTADKSQQQDEDDDEDDRTTLTDVADDYDNRIDYKQEMDFLNKINAAREDATFPDETDTPVDIFARLRFQKYRGLQSFRSSPWNKDEDLPEDYRQIMHFKRFHHTRRRIYNQERDGALPGWYVILHVRDVPRHLYQDHVGMGSPPLVCFSLLPHEQKMSLMNLAVKSHPGGHLRPIKNKERLVFHIGWRRFASCPIFSEHSIGDKHKLCRFFQPGQTVVASMFAPVTFPPCPVSVFRERADGALELVASGSVLSADPNRIVCKRTVLSGHPFKVNRKSAVVRYMFFNCDDIDWFKSVELRTKWGRRGHIKEPLGTHGHMKCQFDSQLKSQDTVLMNLYKRVFPKWSYDSVVLRPPPLFPLSGQREEESVAADVERHFQPPSKKKIKFWGDSADKD